MRVGRGGGGEQCMLWGLRWLVRGAVTGAGVVENRRKKRKEKKKRKREKKREKATKAWLTSVAILMALSLIAYLIASIDLGHRS